MNEFKKSLEKIVDDVLKNRSYEYYSEQVNQVRTELENLKKWLEILSVSIVVAFIVLLAMLVITSSKVVELSDKVKTTEKTLYRVERELVSKHVIEDPLQCCNEG